MHPLAPHRYIRLLRHRARREAALRGWVRGSEVGIVLLATLTGAGVGVLAWGMSAAAQLMRRDVALVREDIDLAGFPLGAVARVVVVDAAGCYAGLVAVPEVHAAPPEITSLTPLLHQRSTVLLPAMNARDAMAAFNLAEADALAVVEPASHQPVGLLTEAHLLRRYGEEVEKRWREESGLWSGTG